MEKTQIKIQLFGAFRDLDPSGFLSLAVALPVAAADFKVQIEAALSRYESTQVDFRSLLRTSALATASQILNDQDLISTAEPLALLPPVCGG